MLVRRGPWATATQVGEGQSRTAVAMRQGPSSNGPVERFEGTAAEVDEPPGAAVDA